MKLNPESFTQFRPSKPWGYYPPDVEEKIAQYENIISALNGKFEEKQLECSKFGQTINRLQDELREMHLQLSSLELPDSTEIVESVVLNDFKNYNNSNYSNSYEPIIDKKEENHSNVESKKEIKNKYLPFTIAK